MQFLLYNNTFLDEIYAPGNLKLLDQSFHKGIRKVREKESVKELN